MRAMAHNLKNRYATAVDMMADMDELRKDPAAIFPALPVKPAVVQDKPKVIPMPETATVAPTEKKPAKGTRTREEAELGKGRVATIAIVSCCVVIMVAAVILLMILASGGLFQAEEATYEVPKLVDMHFDKLPKYPGIQVNKQGSAYSDEYPEGCIISQLPEAGTMVEEGRTVFVIVSLGPKPADVTMPDVAGEKYEDALALLVSLNLGLKVEPKEAYSDTVPAGVVIEASIEKGTVLHKGQKIILTISLGKEIQKATMPNLVRGEGITKESAERMLERRGFTQITWVPVESFLPAGVVVSQSVEADTLIDITTAIIIEYSNGVRPVVTVTYTFDLSDVFEKMGIAADESFLITIMQGSTAVAQDVVLQPGTTSYTLSLTGRDSLEYTIYVNWNYFKTVTVDFV